MTTVEQPGLFDREDARLQAEDRKALGLARAGRNARRIAPAWLERALEAVHEYALAHRTFLLEMVHGEQRAPAGVDPRAWGHVAKEARRRGWIHPSGQYAPANSSNRGPKVLWRSLICRETST